MGESREDLYSGDTDEEESATCCSGLCGCPTKKNKSESSNGHKRHSSTNGENAHSGGERKSSASSDIAIQSQPKAMAGRSSEDRDADVDDKGEVREAGTKDDAGPESTGSDINSDDKPPTGETGTESESGSADAAAE